MVSWVENESSGYSETYLPPLLPPPPPCWQPDSWVLLWMEKQSWRLGSSSIGRCCHLEASPVKKIYRDRERGTRALAPGLLISIYNLFSLEKIIKSLTEIRGHVASSTSLLWQACCVRGKPSSWFYKPIFLVFFSVVYPLITSVGWMSFSPTATVTGLILFQIASLLHFLHDYGPVQAFSMFNFDWLHFLGKHQFFHNFKYISVVRCNVIPWNFYSLICLQLYVIFKLSGYPFTFLDTAVLEWDSGRHVY